MSNGTSFDSTKESLQEILKHIGTGKIQLPDFQRDWVWDDNHIKSLLASVAVSFPIGAVMLYETGNPEVRFKPRLLEGVVSDGGKQPEWLILDGQQRLTSLFQALMRDHPVETRDARGKKIVRWYYMHIPTALNPAADMDDAIRSIPEDRVVRNFRNEPIEDYSTVDLECQAGMFPMKLLFDNVNLMSWQIRFLQVSPDNGQEKISIWTRFTQEIVHGFLQYQLPLIKMFKETPKEAVCLVFEKVNTGGVSLNVFELLTATFAADEFNLREDWNKRIRKIRQYKVLHTIQNDDFLQSISLLASMKRRRAVLGRGVEPEKVPAITCKRKDLLKLTLEEYNEWADKVTKGFVKAAKFMHGQRIFDARDLPYRTQLVPLSAIFTHLGADAEGGGAKNKIARWYWCGVFGELYGGATETRFAKDYPEVVEWLKGGPEPTTVSDAYFTSSRLYTLRTRNSAAYKGLYARLILDGCKDFMSSDEITLQAYFDEKIDIHHIFPKKFCIAKGISSKRYDCIINKTAISSKSNKIIGGKAPSDYLAKIRVRADIDREQLKEHLRSHAISMPPLEANDFDAFFADRENKLLDRIEMAMGKAVQREYVVDENEENDEGDIEIDDDPDEILDPAEGA